jgi:hypothetical protein
MTIPPSSPLSSSLQRVGLTLIGIVLAIAGFLLMIGAVAVGLVVAAVWYVWSLLRGKPPGPVRFSWPPPRFGGMGRRGGAPSPGDVIDIETREVPGPDDRR